MPFANYSPTRRFHILQDLSQGRLNPEVISEPVGLVLRNAHLGQAELINLPERFLVRVPDGVDLKAGLSGP